MKLKTWHYENAVVAAVLITVVLVSGKGPIEWLGALAVYAGFNHAAIAERLQEREAAREKPSVECHRKLPFYWVLKEVCWFAYFLSSHAWSALVGCFLFLLYPFWRRFWRRYHPLSPT